MANLPMQNLAQAMCQNGLIRFMNQYAGRFADIHLKDLAVDEIGIDRSISVNGQRVINFGCDSFLGLDQDPRVKESVVRGLAKWGTHNGASRMFASVRANTEAEDKLAHWLGTEATLIYPSVTLANMGAIPALVSRKDLLVVDEYAHNSIQEAAKIAKANGVPVMTFSHCDPIDLERVFKKAGPYRVALVAIDGVYSMSGALPPLADLNEMARRHNAVLYVDDAHGTAVMGTKGRGTVLDALGNYDNTFVVGSLSKGFSCAGGFIGCTQAFKRLLKMGSSTYVFGGPVVPPYLDAVCTVCDILMSTEYERLRGRLDRNIAHLTTAVARMSLAVLGGQTPIVSILVGDEADTMTAGKFLFDQGYYVQSVTFPAVPYHAGVLRIQVNANHRSASIDGLLQALTALSKVIHLPGPEQLVRGAA